MSSESHDRRLPPELELVLLCLRIEPSDADEHRIRTLLGEELDWDELTALLLSHQIVPSFYRRLHAIAPGCAAGGIRSYLEWMTQDLAKRSILFLGEMLRLLSAFEANGILLIPYKGIVQSWLAYRDLAQRTCLDLDFALRQRDIPRAGELLENLGYESWLQPEELRLAERGQFPGQYAFHRRNLELPVELHTERTLRYFPIPINFDALERRLQTIEIGGRAIRTFSLEDTILFLCVHGAKHFWARLNWICDVGRLAAERPDWEKLAATAAEMHCTRSVLLGSVLAHDLLKAPIPESVLSRARRDSKVAQLARQVREQIARNEESPRGILRRARFRLRSRDRLTEGLLHTWRISTRPTERDWSYAADVTGRSGSSSAFFSSLLRPWRLRRPYGRR
ncbi:MAG: nucleotidyltransferase family protein, partial [Candidatus Acidiferrales bacterium]